MKKLHILLIIIKLIVPHGVVNAKRKTRKKKNQRGPNEYFLGRF